MLMMIPLLAALVGCGGGAAPEGGGDAGCDLSPDNLEGKTFVMLEALPGGEDKPNPMGRMHFEKDGEGMKMKYSVASPSAMYDFECSRKGEGDKTEWRCFEEERLEDWCQALEVHQRGACSAKKLKDLGSNADDATLAEAVKTAVATVDKYRNTDKWNHFVLNNNNLGNKLQGRVYVRVDAKKCRLRISDMYFTIYNGEGLEDSNPTGTNPFVEWDGDELLFETCNDDRWLADLDGELPEDLAQIPPQRVHEQGKPVNFYYLGEKARKAEEGCSYSYDVWANYRKVEEGTALEPGEDGSLMWQTTHQFSSETMVNVLGKNAGILHMVRHQDCAGEKKKIDTVCSAAMH